MKRTQALEKRIYSPRMILAVILFQQFEVSDGEFSEMACLNGEVKFDNHDALIGSGRNLSAAFLKCGDYSSICLGDDVFVSCKQNEPLECHANPPVSGHDMANLGGAECPIDKFGCVPVGVCKLHYILIRKFQEPYNHVLAFLFLLVVILILLLPIYCVNVYTPYGKANRAKAESHRHKLVASAQASLQQAKV